MNANNLYKQILGLKKTIIESHEYLIVFMIFISLMFFSTCSQNHVKNFNFAWIMYIFISIMGVLLICFYFSNKCEIHLHKTAFIIILCFGIITAMLVPICDVSDEVEHLTRAEITSEGILFPHWIGEDYNLTRTYNITDGGASSVLNPNTGYEIPLYITFFSSSIENTVFETDHDTDKINYESFIGQSAFEQNPFYGYLPQAIGILIAKILDLNVIWVLWLARIGNIICYAGLIAYSIKKTPYLKIPLLTIACIPITIYQAASVSIDSLIFGLGILAVSYFIYFAKSEEKSIENREIVIYSIICLLLGLCKLPYLSFIFLLLFISKNNFRNKQSYKWIILCIVIVGFIGVLWSQYSSPTLMHSWRSKYFIDQTAQIQYMLSDSNNIFNFIFQMFTGEIVNLIQGVFNFYGGASAHYSDHYDFISIILQLFLAFILFAYPKKINFSKKNKLGAIIIFLMIYFGTGVVMLLTWSTVGKMNLGMSIRYFIPILALLPIIFGLPKRFVDESINHYAIVGIVVFLGALIFAFATKYY